MPKSSDTGIYYFSELKKSIISEKDILSPKDKIIFIYDYENIKSEELLEILSKLYNKEIVGSKVVSVFGKELLNDIKRNPDIFKDDEEFKKELLKIREENEKQIGERD